LSSAPPAGRGSTGKLAPRSRSRNAVAGSPPNCQRHAFCAARRTRGVPESRVDAFLCHFHGDPHSDAPTSSNRYWSHIRARNMARGALGCALLAVATAQVRGVPHPAPAFQRHSCLPPSLGQAPAITEVFLPQLTPLTGSVALQAMSYYVFAWPAGASTVTVQLGVYGTGSSSNDPDLYIGIQAPTADLSSFRNNAVASASAVGADTLVLPTATVSSATVSGRGDGRGMHERRTVTAPHHAPFHTTPLRRRCTSACTASAP
jgi:hypothetical protein